MMLTARHAPAFAHHTPRPSRLIVEGSDVNERDKLQYTPLHYAARTGLAGECASKRSRCAQSCALSLPVLGCALHGAMAMTTYEGAVSSLVARVPACNMIAAWVRTSLGCIGAASQYITVPRINRIVHPLHGVLSTPISCIPPVHHSLQCVRFVPSSSDVVRAFTFCTCWHIVVNPALPLHWSLSVLSLVHRALGSRL
jgi:hypothetical protein